MQSPTHTSSVPFIISLIMLTLISVSPVMVSAQYSNGSTESGSTRRERIRGYRYQSNELQNKINALPSSATQSVSIPILFGVKLSNMSPNFGDPRGGGTRTHEGQDIMAISGTPIVSPTPAVVMRTGTGPSEGYYVYTANPGGETFVYMHLDRIGEGVTSGVVLQTGDLIGYVGNTGNASGGAAHLHFEIQDSANTATDPYPRLNAEISLPDKITYLTRLFEKTTDRTLLAEFLVTNFRSTLILASQAGLTVPKEIAVAINTIPGSALPTSGSVLPEGDLSLGSSGPAVVTLQTQLIGANAGTASVALKNAGATGYFGSMTKAALIEYQFQKGLSPANGYYGADTRTYMLAHPVTSNTPVSVTPSVVPVKNTTTLVLPRNLSLGMSGDDVRALQQYLNAQGYTVATTGNGSPGREITYFGPGTKAAVIKFQIARGITPTSGYVGPVTRTVLGGGSI